MADPKLRADVHSICDDSGKLHFTRLSTLGGFGRIEERIAKAFNALEQLISKLSSEHVVVVDCSHFHHLRQSREKTLNLFTTENNRPVIVLHNCDSDFLNGYDKLASGHRERFRLRPELETDLQRLTHQINSNSDYMVVPRGALRPSESQVQDALFLEDRYLCQVVKESARSLNTEDSNKRLRSTPLTSSHFFDASRILGNHCDYIWFVSRLAVDMKSLVSLVRSRHGDQDLKEVPRILACTRNGATLASAIQSFLSHLWFDSLRIDVVDRFAPTQRMVEEYDGGDGQNLEGQRWYVYVGDFTIAGTEIKIAEAHSHYRGIPILGGLVIGSVLPILAAADTAQGQNSTLASQFSVFPLVKLSELTLESPLKYQFP